MNDRQLVNNFLDHRDEKAFRALYKSKTPHLYKMAFRLTQNQSLADDLIQEMWIIAIKKLDKFQWKSELKTWLIAILLNLFRSRRKKPEKEVNLDVDTERMDTNIESKLIDAFDLETAISKLPPGYRQIVILHDIEGYTHHEIAQLLGIKEGTSKSQLFHARRALRKYLNEDLIKKTNPRRAYIKAIVAIAASILIFFSGIYFEKIRYETPTQDEEEKITGYFIIQAPSLEEVLEIAQDNPHTKYGGTIAVKSFLVR